MTYVYAKILVGENFMAATHNETLERPVSLTDMKLATPGIIEIIQSTNAERSNPWSLKHARVGLMEIEFTAQVGVLLNGLSKCRTAGQALPELARGGWLSEQQADVLVRAAALQQHLQQIERIALEGQISETTTGAELRQVLTRATGAESFADLTRQLIETQEKAAAIVEEVLS